MNIAGIITAQCSCCPTSHALLIDGHNAQCPDSGQRYADRGDGVFVRTDVRERPAQKIELSRTTFA